MATISVSKVGKAYKQYTKRINRLIEWFLPDSEHPLHSLKWVLRDISFTVNPGEAVGIIGMNGAGKSTLLKIITGTTRPSTGSVHLTGRVVALLELGMGFHPDFTGRQNVVMSAQLLGYRVEEIARLMPEIEAFAEIGDYIDQPVRVYSSGMQMRLAFSVATAIRPDVLIVDEALSVGDAYFVHKSFARIREFREQGTTLLIVSHDKAAIQAICDRAILLSEGKMVTEGKPDAVMDYYNAMLADRQNKTVKQEVQPNGQSLTVSGNGHVKIVDAVLTDSEGLPVDIVRVGQTIALHVKTQCVCAVPELVVGYMIKDRLGQAVFGTNTYNLGKVLRALAEGDRLEFVFEFPANIGQGSYSISIALHTSKNHVACNYEWRDLAVLFNVVNADKAEFTGTAWVPSVARIVS